ncbi:helix-turn-helix domain-containing protein [Phenylobacterium sp. J426]|uniref:helix-turn-helix domain-containing protein n=1 Tax=Phenylobacterium sp. J426 TaxID=2898439 RepID=UPI002150FE30|nr:helix-turn-helix transcriptional regulator [Phenylobacterium sp. J426]MCR5875136.1 helix-turn-helix domain-containing protein [Phenylobacterium sp. J426]
MADEATPLRTFRHAQTPRWSLKDVAEALGLSESQVSRIERDGTTSLPLAMKLAKITGLPVESFAPRTADHPTRDAA